MNRTRKIKNSTLAMDAAAATIPKKPNTPAITAITKNIADHVSISSSSLIECYENRFGPSSLSMLLDCRGLHDDYHSWRTAKQLGIFVSQFCFQGIYS